MSARVAWAASAASCRRCGLHCGGATLLAARKTRLWSRAHLRTVVLYIRCLQGEMLADVWVCASVFARASERLRVRTRVRAGPSISNWIEP
jgi:hypothetical protein